MLHTVTFRKQYVVRLLYSKLCVVTGRVGGCVMLTVVRQVVCSDREGGGCVMLTVLRQVVCSDREGGAV